MNILLSKGINDDEFKKLIDATNSTSEVINIYLIGNGGALSSLEMILNVINSNPSKFKIIATGKNESANFLLLIYAKCEKIIMPHCSGAYHLPYNDITLSCNGNPTYEQDEYTIRRQKEVLMPIIKKEFIDFGFTKQQINRINKSYCIYYTANEIKELLKKDWEYGSV